MSKERGVGKPWADCECTYDSTCRTCLDYCALTVPAVYTVAPTPPRFLAGGVKNPAWQPTVQSKE